MEGRLVLGKRTRMWWEEAEVRIWGSEAHGSV